MRTGTWRESASTHRGGGGVRNTVAVLLAIVVVVIGAGIVFTRSPVPDPQPPTEIFHQPRGFGDTIPYPDDYPADAPRLSGVLLDASSGPPAWSLRYSRIGYTTDEALTDLAEAGYAESARTLEPDGLVRVSLVGAGAYRLDLSWSDRYHQTQMDLTVDGG
jgi:hypothetical protein